VPLPTADRWFPDGGAYRAIARTLRRPPAEALDAWLVVGHEDTAAEMGPWVRERGYRAFKLKLLGRDAAADAARTAEVFEIARAHGAAAPRLAVDSNCANPDADSVLEYLARLRADAPDAYAALEYLEQPTGRDIDRHTFDWRAVAAHRPVLLDEGLNSMERLALAEEQGWSGIAIKTCRGHSFALAAAARARERGLLLAAQDLTNPGIAAIHSALLAAHLPVFNGIELNSPQFTPEANADYLPRLRSLFEPTDGRHIAPDATADGLGSQL
jgi:L-alanine-DL-glutamate epimerase-like enolase superfamily enzyme